MSEIAENKEQEQNIYDHMVSQNHKKKCNFKIWHYLQPKAKKIREIEVISYFTSFCLLHCKKTREIQKSGTTYLKAKIS